MNEHEKRSLELEQEMTILQTRHRMIKRELDQLDKAFETVPTVRLAEMRLRYAGILSRITDLMTQNKMERELYKGRHAKHGSGNVV